MARTKEFEKLAETVASFAKLINMLSRQKKRENVQPSVEHSTAI